MNKKLGIKEIAKRARVAIATVDRVLHHRGGIKRETKKIKSIVIGYDLIEQNINQLINGNIDYLISQKSDEQAYKAVTLLFDNLYDKNITQQNRYSPIDIIIKENIDYYC